MEIKAANTLKASSDTSLDVSSPKTTIEGKANATVKGALVDVVATGDTNIKGAEVKLKLLIHDRRTQSGSLTHL